MDNVQYNNLKDLLVRLLDKIDGLSSRRPTGWDSFIITSVDADIDPLTIEYYKAGGNIGNAININRFKLQINYIIMEILSILVQVAQSEHESEERAIVRYKESEESPIESKIINKESLSSTDKGKWTSFVNMIENKLV
jgi:hypothetical protein